MRLLLVLSMMLLSGAASAAGTLAPPFDIAAIRAGVGREDTKNFTCEKPPAPLRDLNFESMYAKDDATHSTVDPAADAAYKKAYAPIAAFEKGLASMANRYVRSSPPRADIAACASGWLAAWAADGALLGDINAGGEQVRKWLLASVANDWLQVRGAGDNDAITKWIHDVAKAVVADFSRHTENDSRRNNHLYWAAWGVAAAAVAVNDAEMFRWAMDKARSGTAQIAPDGTLPLELARGKRAYLYHMFAAMPLFMLAELGARNGVDLFSDGALQRLGALNLRNLSTGADFEKMTGAAQDMKRVGTSSDLGWVEIYGRHYADPLAKKTLDDFRPLTYSRMGGDITLLYSKAD